MKGRGAVWSRKARSKTALLVLDQLLINKIQIRCYNKSKKQNYGGDNMAKNERFERVFSQGALTVTEIWVDKETGVNYIFHQSGYAGGMTPLLDRDGKPVISPIVNR